MKKRFFAGLVGLVGLVGLTGCASTIASVTESTKGKTVIVWEDGWAAYISMSTGTTDDPTPHGKIFCGKVNKGLISTLPGHDLTGAADVIRATKSDLNVTATGVTNTGTAK